MLQVHNDLILSNIQKFTKHYITYCISKKKILYFLHYFLFNTFYVVYCNQLSCILAGCYNTKCLCVKSPVKYFTEVIEHYYPRFIILQQCHYKIVAQADSSLASVWNLQHIQRNFFWKSLLNVFSALGSFSLIKS